MILRYRSSQLPLQAVAMWIGGVNLKMGLKVSTFEGTVKLGLPEDVREPEAVFTRLKLAHHAISTGLTNQRIAHPPSGHFMSVHETVLSCC
jgi:hypothetical protein